MARFKPGQSGNTKGRPRGIADRRTKYRKTLEEHAPELVEKMIELALGGDVPALKACVDRLIPALRPNDEPVHFSAPKGASLSEQGQAVVIAASTGELTPQQAQALLTALASQARLVEIDELEKRIAALELDHDD